MIRKANAVWQGTGKEGSGTLTSPSTVLNNTPYSFKTRFENEDGKAGTNPEELIAAAHAGCFTMALSFQLSGANFTPTKLATEASITMVQENGGFKFKSIHLHLEATVPNISEEQFKELADIAKKNCPVSQALSAIEITLSSNLVK
jgi:osmotically inducible protein OsmC